MACAYRNQTGVLKMKTIKSDYIDSFTKDSKVNYREIMHFMYMLICLFLTMAVFGRSNNKMFSGFYRFFDYKYNIAGYDGQDYYGIMHSVYQLICIIFIPLLVRLFKNKDSKTITKMMRVIAIALIIEEITKITWESYWDIKTGQGFNFYGILPLETCSLFIYSLTAAAFGKGKVREYALCWMSSIGIIGGASYIIFTNALKWYPFFTYGAFHSMIFHFLMVFMGLLVIFSSMHRFTLSDINHGFMPQLLLATLVIPLDYLFNWDYMLLHHAYGVPIIESIGEILEKGSMPFVTTLLMLLLYYVIGGVMTVIAIRIQSRVLHTAEKKNETANKWRTSY